MSQGAADYHHCIMDSEGFPCFVGKNDMRDEEEDFRHLRGKRHHQEPENIRNLYDASSDHLHELVSEIAFDNSVILCRTGSTKLSSSLDLNALPYELNAPSYELNASSCSLHGMAGKQGTKGKTFKDEPTSNGQKLKQTHYRNSKMHFKIPKIFLQQGDTQTNEGTTLNIRPMKISLWDEYYYGPSILNKESQRTTPFPGFFRNFGTVVSKQVLEKVVFSTYIILFFFTCFIFNFVGKLACYCVVKNHLSIHERAYTKRQKIQFSENVFQGPYHVFLRFMWCAHCCQSLNEKVVLKLMKEYRDEITGLS